MKELSEGHLGKHVQDVIPNGKMRRNSQEALQSVPLGQSEPVVAQIVLGGFGPFCRLSKEIHISDV